MAHNKSRKYISHRKNISHRKRYNKKRILKGGEEDWKVYRDSNDLETPSTDVESDEFLNRESSLDKNDQLDAYNSTRQKLHEDYKKNCQSKLQKIGPKCRQMSYEFKRIGKLIGKVQTEIYDDEENYGGKRTMRRKSKKTRKSRK
jgi:hypothetical protein